MAEKKPPAKKAPAKKAPVKKAGASTRAPGATRPPAAGASTAGTSRSRGSSTGGWWDRRKRKRAAKKARLRQLPPWKRIGRVLLIALAWFAGIFVVLLAATLFLYYRFSKVPSPEALPLPQSTTIEYSDGSVLARVGEVDRTSVPLSQVPDSMKWAVLAAEDRNFYSEPGFSIKGTARAAVSDIFGGDTQGGSGITQQYVKNAYLSADRTLSRKLRELMISVKLSRDHPKDEILGYYLNTVYFGRGVYGVESAASAYFGEDVSKLTVSQSALLAGLLRDPGNYDPSTDLQAATGRWNYVLDGMVSTKHLAAADRAALTFPTVKPPKDRLGVTGPKALLVQRVLSELDDHGISENEVNTRGLVVRTTISAQAQAAAQHAITTTFGSLTDQQRNLKNALVAIDPKSGAVVAYYGGPSGTGYDGKDDYFDYAGLGARPAGSSFKPYTLATVLTQNIEKQSKQPLTISSYVDGSYCVTIEGRKICNDPGDQKYSSKTVKIADAMKYSLNTSFDLLAQFAGPDEVAKTAHAVGISAKDSNGKPTLVDADGNTGFGIGIGDYAVSPMDQATGYATFANGGTYYKPYFVREVTTSSGASVYRHKIMGTRVLNAQVANDVTLSLEPIAAWSNDPLDQGRVSAAKTGTVGITGSPNGDNSDAWMVGYTPQVAVAVWAGSGNSTTPIYNQWGSPEYGSDLPGHTWQLFMNTYLAGHAMVAMPTQQQILQGTNMVTPSPTAKSTPSSTPTSKTSGSAVKSSAAPSPSASGTASANPSVTGSPSDSGPATGTSAAGSPGGTAQPSG
jgi:membrane peptidoglycan carboxypeptidase